MNMESIRKICSLLIICISGLSVLKSQNIPDGIFEPDYYNFVSYNKNKIIMNSPAALEHFFQALDGLAHGKQNKVHVVHIGDSHIQADFFTNHVRDKLIDVPYFGNGGRGFLFPYSVAKTNNPSNYISLSRGKWTGFRNSLNKYKSDWGLAGVTALTYDPSAKFTIKLNGLKDSHQFYEAREVRVYYPTEDSTSYELRLLVEDRLQQGIPDSNGFVTFQLDSNYEEFNFKLLKTKPYQNHFLIQGLSFYNNDPGIIYSSIGVNGAKYDSYLKCGRFIDHLKSLNPDLIVLSLGTNDAYNSPFNVEEFKQHVQKIVSWIKEAAPNTSVLITTPGDNLRRRRYTNNDNIKVVRELGRIAQKNKFALWDFYNIMGGLNSMKKWREYGLGKRDYIHLTSLGYRLQGELLFNALILDKYFGEYQKIISTGN